MSTNTTTKKLISLTLLFLCSTFWSFGQVGNEWINYSQSYYKIKIAEEGIYKISQTALSNVGINTNNIDPRNIMMFRNGVQIPIYVVGEQDGTFNTTDYIEFYGYKNDGLIDQRLYRSPEDQPNSEYSIHTDTAAYYLTWSANTPGLRFTDYYDPNYAGKTSDTYFKHTEVKTYSSDFFGGIPIGNSAIMLLSEYASGEGFHKWVWSSQAKFEIDLPGLDVNGGAAIIKARAYSGNHNESEISGGYNHEFGLSLETRGKLIASKKTLGYQKIDVAAIVSANELKPTTRFYMGEITYSGSGIHVNRLEVQYPRKMDMLNKTYLRLESNLNSAFVSLSNYNAAATSPIVYDLSNKRRIIADKQLDNRISFNLPSNGDVSVIIEDEATFIEILELKEVEMINFSANNAINYLIITNKKLEIGASAYKTYRESAAGGGYTVDVVYVNDLYETNGYGIESPLAIRNYIKMFPLIRSNVKHILFLGKGQLYSRIRKNNELKEVYNLVPAIGQPASDYLYVSTLDHSDLAFNYSIGRIPARDNEQINIYLDKLIAYENQQPAVWQKKVIQLAGGNAGENQIFTNYLSNYYNILRDSSFGGYRELFSKNEPIPVQESLTDKIHNELNDGASMLTYFGHGAAEVTEISLGEPSQLDNLGKTPLFFFNGCALGNTFEDQSLGERFLFEPNKGALGWLASSNYSTTNSLYLHSLEIHKALFQTHYGEGVGVALKVASSKFGSPGQQSTIPQSRQLVYHGDPALDVFTRNEPDYYTSKGQVIIDPYVTDSIELELELTNVGRSIDASLDLNIKVENSSGGVVYHFNKSIKAPSFRTNATLQIPASFLSGLITFDITLDSVNRIDEIPLIGESNNHYRLPHLFKQKSAAILSPTPDAIVNNTELEMCIQLPGMHGVSKNINIQWDTTPYFQTPIGTKSIYSIETLIKENVTLPYKNNTDYYLRCNYEANGSTSEWVSVTFGYIANDSTGITEGNIWKKANLDLENMYYDTVQNQYTFATGLTQEYSISTSGGGLGRFRERWIKIGFEPAIFNWWPANGVNLIAINPIDGSRYFEENSSFNIKYSTPWGQTQSYNTGPYFIPGEKCGVYNFNVNIDQIQDSFTNFLNRIPVGYHLIMLNGYKCDPSSFKVKLLKALEEYGMQKLKTLKEGEPFAFFGTKGTIPGTAFEYTGDYDHPVTSVTEQYFARTKFYSEHANHSTIRSKVLSGANKWKSLTLYMKDLKPGIDTFSVSVLGSNNMQLWDTVILNSTSLVTNLESIDAKEYPFIQLVIQLYDNEERSPAHLDRWKINYVGASEGTIVLTDNFLFKSDTVQKGEEIYFDIDFTNILDKQYDSTSYLLTIKNLEAGTTDTVKTKAVSTLDAYTSVHLSDTLSTLSLEGEYELLLGVNPNEHVTEYNYQNNYYSHRFVVQKDNKNPLLDVVFDGQHILDQDIVSPNTAITISVKDENPYIVLDDPAYISAILTHPSGDTDTLDVTDQAVRFVPSNSPEEQAQLIYQGEDLASGTYNLAVSVTDASGNESSEQGYEINFNVVRESSITNLYPYPNPFTTQMKFVYTLTGSKVPEYMKIQILSISGKIVREITQNELGTIKIGNNISEFTWDGTDEFGDQLANGVYLYKVTARIDGEDIQLMQSDGDAYFNNGYGKIYLAR